MKLRSLSGTSDQTQPCLFSDEPEAADVLIAAMSQADYLAVSWEYPSAKEELLLLEEVLGPRLLVPEEWASVLPQTGVLIPSSISGGDLRTRFRDAAAAYPGRCWLLTERLCAALPLPCPDGQGKRTNMPEEQGFYSESLGCRYVHIPGQVILFDTDETLAQKCRWAVDAGFLGWLELD